MYSPPKPMYSNHSIMNSNISMNQSPKSLVLDFVRSNSLIHSSLDIPDTGSPSWHSPPHSPTVKLHPAFDTSLGLNDFDESALLSASRALLENKMAEFIAEFKVFLQTQSKIYELKQEHISIDLHDDQSHRRQLVDSIQKKIDSKKEELCRKWDEYVQDRQEIAILRRQISEKHLSQFKEMVHFESQHDFISIMQSDTLSHGDKVAFESKLKRYRGAMVSKYLKFREDHFREFQEKMSDSLREEKQTDTI